MNQTFNIYKVISFYMALIAFACVHTALRAAKVATAEEVQKITEAIPESVQ